MTPANIAALLDHLPFKDPVRQHVSDAHDNIVQLLEALASLRASRAATDGVVSEELIHIESKAAAMLDGLDWVAGWLMPEDEQDRNDAAIDRAMDEVA